VTKAIAGLIVSLVAALHSLPAAAQMSVAAQEDFKQRLKSYNACVLRVLDKDWGAKSKTVRTSRSFQECDASFASVRQALLKVPGASNDRVDEQMRQLRYQTGQKLLAALIVVELAARE
jgi:hypothetical protein